MFGSRIPLPTIWRRADVLLVAGGYDTPLLPWLRVASFIECLLCFGVLLVMSRAWVVASGSLVLIKPRGLRDLEAAGQGGCRSQLVEWDCSSEEDAAR